MKNNIRGQSRGGQGRGEVDDACDVTIIRVDGRGGVEYALGAENSSEGGGGSPLKGGFNFGAANQLRGRDGGALFRKWHLDARVRQRQAEDDRAVFCQQAGVNPWRDVGCLRIRLWICRKWLSIQRGGNEFGLREEVVALCGDVEIRDGLPGERGGECHAEHQHEQGIEREAGADGLHWGSLG